MNLEELNELSDTEKWEWVLNNIKLVSLMDEPDEEVYFVIQEEDTGEDFELHFNEFLEMNESLSYLFKSLGFESHNY